MSVVVVVVDYSMCIRIAGYEEERLESEIEEGRVCYGET